MHDSNLEVESKTILGFWLFILSDIILFSVIFATYAVLRPGPTGEWVSLPKALAEALLLLTSSFVCGLSRNPNRSKAILLLGLTCVLGIVFSCAVLSDFAHLIRIGNDWQKSGILSAYFLLVGTLLMHLFVGILWMIVLIAQIWQRGMIASTHRRTMCLQMFWHFLNIVWIGIYSWIYLLR